MNSMQHEFNEVCKHLIKQGKKARNFIGQCRYRTEDGLSCAVGCRIPDSAYTPEMEGRGVYSLLDEFSNKLPPEIEAYKYMFCLLQNVHDISTSWTSKEKLKTLLRGVAINFSLEIPDIIKEEATN